MGVTQPWNGATTVSPLTQQTTDVLYRALEALATADTISYERLEGHLATIQPDPSFGTAHLPAFAWSTWVVTTACRRAFDQCYGNSWNDLDGINELIDRIGSGYGCPQRDIAGFLTALAAGAHGQAPPLDALPGPREATRAGLATLAWLRQHTGLDPLQ